MSLSLPEEVRIRAVATGHERWVEALPAMVALIESEWAIAVGRVYSGGSEALVADAVLPDQSRAVLKIFMPRQDDSIAHEIIALRLAGGEGCAQLLRGDEERGAVLLERLGRPLRESDLSHRAKAEVLCRLARQMWRPAHGLGLVTGVEKGRWLAEYITTMWKDLGHPCSERAYEHAIACVERRIAAHAEARAVLVHGDIHEFNALQSGDGYKLIDPDGLLAEPEYDLGVILRDELLQIDEADPRSNARWLAGLTGLDETAIWEWSVAERLSTALLCTSMGYEPTGRNYLASAERAAAFG